MFRIAGHSVFLKKAPTIILVYILPIILWASPVRAENFSKDLYFGLKNDNEVIKLQRFLTSQGLYDGPITGNFLSLTQQAVKDFQRKNGILPTAGYWGLKTRTKANSLNAAQLPANVASSSTIATTTTSDSKTTLALSSSTVNFIAGKESRSEIQISPIWLLSATTTDARWPNIPEPAQREIDPRAVVALYCHGKNEDEIWKGSGNIIHPKGYILTNRHVAANARYCEVALPDETVKLPTRDEIGDVSKNPAYDISGWRPYKAINYFMPEQSDSLSEQEKFELDFAIMKIDSVNNEDCQIFNRCKSLPNSFPYNLTSNLFISTSSGAESFPFMANPIGYRIPIQSYEMITYGYPGIGGGTGSSHVLRGNIGYAIGYMPGDKQYAGYPMVMLVRVLHGTFGGSSGSGVFYRGHIVGLTYAAFQDITVVQSVIPMPFISMILNKNGKDWVLDPASRGE